VLFTTENLSNAHRENPYSLKAVKGTSHRDVMFDTRAYILEFPDGAEAEYTANIIAENMYAQCNIDGEQYLLLKSICDHKKDGHAVEKADAYITVNN
jgi:hypothetical protein